MSGADASGLVSRSGNVTPALRLYRRGLEIEPGNVQLLHAAAQMQMQQGQSEVITLAQSVLIIIIIISHHYHHHYHQSKSVLTTGSG